MPLITQAAIQHSLSFVKQSQINTEVWTDVRRRLHMSNHHGFERSWRTAVRHV